MCTRIQIHGHRLERDIVRECYHFQPNVQGQGRPRTAGMECLNSHKSFKHKEGEDFLSQTIAWSCRHVVSVLEKKSLLYSCYSVSWWRLTSYKLNLSTRQVYCAVFHYTSTKLLITTSLFGPPHVWLMLRNYFVMRAPLTNCLLRRGMNMNVKHHSAPKTNE